MDGSFVDMGGTFDLFSEISHPDYKKLTKTHGIRTKIGEIPITKVIWAFTEKIFGRLFEDLFLP